MPLELAQQWKHTRRAFAVGMAMGVVLFLLPLLVLGVEEEVTVLPSQPTPVPSPSSAPAWEEGETLRVLQEDGTVEEMALSDYLWRVGAAEMPTSFEPDALRAQAVFDRTYSRGEMNGGSLETEGEEWCTYWGIC